MENGVISGLLYSQIGYDLFDIKRALIRSNRLDTVKDGTVFRVMHVSESIHEEALVEKVAFWGEKWGLFWWVLDFSSLDKEGTYVIRVSDKEGKNFECLPFEIGKNLLMRKTLRPVGLDQFKMRAEKARNQKGWKDCGSTMREAYTQALAIIGLSDLLIDGYEFFSVEENV